MTIVVFIGLFIFVSFALLIALLILLIRTAIKTKQNNKKNAIINRNSKTTQLTTEQKDELSFRFFDTYHDEVKKLEDEMVDNALAIGGVTKKWLKTATTDDIKEKVQRCDNTIASFNRCKEFCASKGKGGQIYFHEMWECCHNSKNSSFNYIDSIIEDRATLLEYLEPKER